MRSVLRGISSSLVKQVARKTTAVVLCYAFLGANMQAAIGETERTPQRSATWVRDPLPLLQNLPAISPQTTLAASPTPIIDALQRQASSPKQAAQHTQLASLAAAPLSVLGKKDAHFQIGGSSSGTYSSISEDFNKTPIVGSSVIWFSSVLRIGGAGPNTPVRIFLRGSTVKFTANGVAYNINVPDGNVIFSTTATKATTSYDPTRNLWTTIAPTTLTDYKFLTGVELPVPAAGLPATINPVTWDGYFYTDTAGVNVNWQWAAAVYKPLSATLSDLGVKPVDDSTASQYLNNDRAGTPENFKPYVLAGARGAGGTEYVGHYAGTATLGPVVQIPNYPPVANAGPAQTVHVTDTVQLDGTGSTDRDGDPLTYRWTLTSIPAGSAAVLNAANTAKPTFVVDKPGSYIAQLVVNDGKVDSAPSTVTISTTNSAPVADAGPDQTAHVTDTVHLDGSKSHDVDGDSLTYQWSLTTVPQGSNAQLVNSTAINPTFLVDVKGTYVAQLIVNDGQVNSAADTVTISTVNSPPVANPGPPQKIHIGKTVNLDGSNSTDVDGDKLTFHWSLLSVPDGSTAALSNPTSLTPSFVPDKLGDYVVQLIVNDGTVDSQPATVTVTTENTAPVADAGPDQTAHVTDTVHLDGSKSHDVDGDPLTYQWTLITVPEGSNAQLADPTAENPTFLVDVRGTYVAQLIVNDGHVNSAPDTVTVSTVNSPPIANPGLPQKIIVGRTVNLDGHNSSDVDGDQLTFRWSLLSVPDGSTSSLANPTSVTPSFVPDKPGDYVVQLIVNDGTVDSQPATVTVTSENTPPLANAGSAKTVQLGATVNLDGSASSDADGQSLTYHWSLTPPSGSSAALVNADTATPSFVADVPGNYVAQLIVNDGFANSAPATVVISTINSVPVADVGAGQKVPTGTTVNLDGTASSDADNDPLTYRWAIIVKPDGSTAALSDPTAPTLTLVPDLEGTYVIQLIVNDGTVDSAPATVMVQVENPNKAPVVDAGPDQTITQPTDTLTLNGTVTDDGKPVGVPLKITWTQVSGPATVTFSDPTSAVTQATFTAVGDYVLRLTGDDSLLNNHDDVTITVKPRPNDPPVVDAGQDQTVPFPNHLQLQGSVTDDGRPVGGTLTATWSEVSGPTQAIFADIHDPHTVVTLNAEGVYKFQLTGDDSDLQTSKFVTITTVKPDNLPPVVTVGPDQTIELPVNSANITGSATDDGQPAGSTLAYSWKQLGAQTPGVVFGNSASPTTTATFSTPGVYVLQLTATEVSTSTENLSGSANMRVTVLPHNNPPVVNAGKDQTIFLPANSVTLAGTATDDGLPAGKPFTTSWSVVIGPGTVTFANAASPTTTATFSSIGTYVLRLTASDSVFTVTSDVTITVKPNNQPPLVNAGANQTVLLPSNVSTLPLVPTLIQISSGFNSEVGIDYHQPTNKLVTSVNFSSNGFPHNFELVAADGTRTQFSNVSGLTDEVYIATARDEGDGKSRGGFIAGEMFTGSGVAGVIVRISPDGRTVKNPWVTLPGENGLMRGQLYIDRTGVWGGDLIVVTTTGHLWRITSAGVPTFLTTVPTSTPEGLQTVPNDPAKYGPWAGKIITGGENTARVFVVDTQGNLSYYDLGIAPENIKLVPPNENYFAVNLGANTLVGIPASELSGMVGDVIMGEEFSGALWQVHWNGSKFETTKFASLNTGDFEGSTFAPAGIAQIGSTTGSVVLNGTASDDGLPVGGSLTTAWTKVSGPGIVTFTSPTTPVTTASFSQPGTYVLRLTGNDSELASSSDVTVVIAANQAPVVSAGPSQEITFPAQASLQGSVSDDGLPAGKPVNTFWTKLYGPGTVTFSTAHTYDPSADFSASSNPSGTWTYGWTPTRGGAFTPMPAEATGPYPAWYRQPLATGSPNYFPIIGNNDTLAPVQTASDTIVQPGITMHPGPTGQNAVLRWTAPNSGTFLIQGRFYAEAPTTTDVAILLNSSTTILSGNVNGTGGGVPFSFARTLNAGDLLDFSVGYGNGNFNSDSTGLALTITPAGDVASAASFSAPGDYMLRLAATDTELYSFSDVHVHVATSCTTAPSGLVGWWPGDGDNRDLVNGNTGVTEDGVAFVPGMVGSTFSLNGTAADIAVPASTALNVKSFTFETWIFPKDYGQRPILEYDTVAPGSFGPHFWEGYNSAVQATSGALYANIIDVNGGQHIFATGAGAISIFQWSHVALTYDQTTGLARIYVNGAALAQASLGTFTPSTNRNLYIGARVNNGGHFLGNIDEVSVYNRALSPAEIQSIYAAGSAGKCKPTGPQAPVVSAGLDQSITLPTTQVTLNGSASDPNGGTLSTAWSVVSASGTVSFGNAASPTTTATFSGAGTYVLRLTASNAQLTASNDVIITVNIPVNTAPVVSAGPNQTIQLPNSVALNGTATDDGLPLGSTLTRQWSKISGPGSVTFSAPTQAVTQASFTTPGNYTLQLSASDSEFTTTSAVSVTVLPSPNQNQAPTVAVNADLKLIQLPFDTISLGAVIGDDGLPVGAIYTQQWSVGSGPGPVVFSDPTNVATQATFVKPGLYVIRLTASDSQLSGSGTITINVLASPTNLAPTVRAGANQTIRQPNNVVNLNGFAADDGLPTGSTLAITWTQVSGPAPVVFSSPNTAATQATFSQAGTYVLQLAASDSLLGSTSNTTVVVLAPIGPPPTLSINLQDGSDLTKPTPITGTVSSGHYVAQYALSTDDNPANLTWTTFAQGNAPASGSLATFDPTTLLNGSYQVRIVTTDDAGQSASIQTGVSVSRNLKIGNFTLSFEDVSVPLPGLPIQVFRTYDSRDKGVGDFGLGWRVSVRSIRVQKSGNFGQNWEETVQWQGFFPQYCLEPGNAKFVTVTFPDGPVYKFNAVSSPECQQFVPITAPQIGFQQVPTGSNTAGAKLEPIGDTDLLLDGPVPGPVNIINFDLEFANYTQFRLTTKEGYVYILDQKLGATQVTDPNGNTLTINDNGIVHSSGPSVVFVRDAQHRITQITDPSQHSITYFYNADGDLDHVTDRAQQTITFHYDNHYLTQIDDPRGVQAAKNVYDDSGRLTDSYDATGVNHIHYDHQVSTNTDIITDRLGHATTYEYDDDGNIVHKTEIVSGVQLDTSYTYDSNGNKLSELLPGHINPSTFTYDALGNQLTQTDPLGHTTTYTYNAHKQATSIKDANIGAQQGTTTIAYDPQNGNVLSTTDAEGHVTSNTYWPNGQVKTTSVDGVQTASFAYDGAGNITQQTDALNNVITYTYDGNGNKKTQKVTRTLPNGTSQDIITNFDYDGNNRVTKTTYNDGSFTQTVYNAIGKQSDTIQGKSGTTETHTTHYDYDDHGRLTSTTYPDQTTEVITYDANGNRKTVKDRGNHTTTYDYDELNRLTKTHFADGSFTETVFDAAGRVSDSYDQLRNKTHYDYDDADRRIAVTDALQKKTQFGYDNNGNQTSMTDANLHTTTYVYDKLGRRTQVIYHDQSTETTHYDLRGHVDYKIDQAGKRTDYSYDLDGRLKSVTQHLGTTNLVTSYGYDELGNRTSQTDANQHTTSYAYDDLGRRISRKLAMGQTESYFYDALGNLQSKTDFSGHTTTYDYDENNRLKSKTADTFFSQGSCGTGACGAAQISFTYTATGKRKTMTDASGTTTYTYDPQTDRLLSKQTPFGTLTYSYDAAGNLKSIASSNGDGASMAYTYDADNRLKTVTDASGDTNYAYDNVGNLQSFAYPNGVVHGYTYNPLNRLTNLAVCTASASPCDVQTANRLNNYAYTLGPAGNRTSVAELSGRTVTYGYDDLYRLTSETISRATSQNGSINYTYDAVGNRTQLTSTVPIIPSSGTLFYDPNDRTATDTYDDNGNAINSGGDANVYDFENHLVQHGGVSIVYDGDGNRVAETVGGVTTQYLVDTANPTGYAQVVDELQSGSVTRHYTWGLELIAQSQITNQQWTASFYGFDGHGSVRFLTDSAGAITDTYDYDAFGNLLASTGSTPNNYLFAGEQFDQSLGIYYNRARYYDQRSGRFWTADTWEGRGDDPRSLHKYAYSLNDPMNRIDPSGNESLAEVAVTISVASTLILNSLTFLTFLHNTAVNAHIDGYYFSARFNYSGFGGTAGLGFDIVYQRSTGTFWVAPTGEFGTSPVSIFAKQRMFSANVAVGPIFGMNDANDMSEWSVQAVFPLSILRLLPGAMFSANKAWGAMTQLAKRSKNARITDAIAAVGVSTSGPAFFQVGFRNNSFSALVSYSGDYQRFSDLGASWKALVQPIISRAQGVLFDDADVLADNGDAFISTVEGLNF